jgi:hypothetical protein
MNKTQATLLSHNYISLQTAGSEAEIGTEAPLAGNQ